ncbi:MAG: hypothetical protein HZA54_08805 [Planctomycetes bacterium]|nr:hypothetical protein [Planctomycetota bacterium]
MSEDGKTGRAGALAVVKAWGVPVAAALLVLSSLLPIYPDRWPEMCCWQPGTPWELLDPKDPALRPLSYRADFWLSFGVLLPHLWAALVLVGSMAQRLGRPLPALALIERAWAIAAWALAHAGFVDLVWSGPPGGLGLNAEDPPWEFVLACASGVLAAFDLRLLWDWRIRRRLETTGRNPHRRVLAAAAAGWFGFWLLYEASPLRFHFDPDYSTSQSLRLLGPVLREFVEWFPGTHLALLASGLLFTLPSPSRAASIGLSARL